MVIRVVVYVNNWSKIYRPILQLCQTHIHTEAATETEPPLSKCLCQILAVVWLNWGKETLTNIFHIIAQFEKWVQMRHKRTNIRCIWWRNNFSSPNRQITTLSTTKRSNISLHICLFLTLFLPQTTAASTHMEILACHFLSCMHENFEQLKKGTVRFFYIFLLCFITVFWTFFRVYSSFSLWFDNSFAFALVSRSKIDCCRCWLSKCRSYQNIWPINLLMFSGICSAFPCIRSLLICKITNNSNWFHEKIMETTIAMLSIQTDSSPDVGRLKNVRVCLPFKWIIWVHIRSSVCERMKKSIKNKVTLIGELAEVK